MNRIGALIKGATEGSLSYPLCEDTSKRQLSMNQGTGSHQTVTLSASLSWASQPLELWQISFCSL